MTGSTCLRKKFQKNLKNLSSHQVERELAQIICWSGISGLAGMIKRQLIHFDEL